jgi:superfamily II DNA or RNA helicase
MGPVEIRSVLAVTSMTKSTPATAPPHPAQRRYLAEDLVRRRRSDEQRRYTAPQRSAKVDANPHQIDAVIFALARVREGGCILADEVGLGKTIEAGLVTAQLLAEGARRVLLVAPKPLLGQWRQELFQLFGLPAREAETHLGGFDGDGIFLVGREAAGSEKGQAALLASEPFDLCIIDEAHEVFANIYRRFDELGQYREDGKIAQIAGRLREVLTAKATPVLLLTATPIQNGLSELWGLVQYVDPLGTLLGDLPTFREVFCGDDDRHVATGQAEELRTRLRAVVQRTLRRDAQDFMEKPFVSREARMFEYSMTPAEKALYDDVTRYLLDPNILAFRGARHLVLLGYHRRLASSNRALAVSLENVAARLRRRRAGEETAETEDADALGLMTDLEEDDIEADLDADRAETGPGEALSGPLDELTGELRRIEDLVQRAEALGNEDSKFRALLQAVTFAVDRAAAGKGAGKLVVFTESLVTQEYLRDRLVESRLATDAEITLFRGTNDSRRAKQALEFWRSEVPQGEGTAPSTDMATRLALVHEFRTRSRVFISTDAGGKGLNLQFCDTVVNYDLPWNPQKIEQRIGRCHRYGQQRDVTVINFLAKDNEAQALTFEILSQKLDLFGTVLDASDHILHRPQGPGDGALASALGSDFESELRRIYERSRTLDEVSAELRALREKVGEERRRFEETHSRTADLIEKRFDEGVQSVFRSHREELPRALEALDRDLVSVVLGYLDAIGVGYKREAQTDGELLQVAPSPHLPPDLRPGITAAIGASRDHASLHLAHPLVLAAVADARLVGQPRSAVARLPDDAPADLGRYAGRRGRLRLVKISFDGFEQVELLLPVMVLDNGEAVDPSLGDRLLRGRLTATEVELAPSVTDDALEDATQEILFTVQAQVDAGEQLRFEAALRQAERFIDDRLLVLRKRRRVLAERFEQNRIRRDGAAGSEARTEAEIAVVSAQMAIEEVDGSIDRLERRDDETLRRFEDHIQRRRYTPPRVERVFDMELVIE